MRWMSRARPSNPYDLFRGPSRQQTRRNQAFTLVELIVVVLLIGILSSIALTALTDQQDKAKSTEATSKISKILRDAYSDYQASSNEDDAINGALTACLEASASGKFIYGLYEAGGAQATPINGSTAAIDLTPANILIVGADPNNASYADANLIRTSEKAPLVNGKIFGCINLTTGKTDGDYAFKDAVDILMNGSGNTPTVAGLDCS